MGTFCREFSKKWSKKIFDICGNNFSKLRLFFCLKLVFSIGKDGSAINAANYKKLHALYGTIQNDKSTKPKIGSQLLKSYSPFLAEFQSRNFEDVKKIKILV